MANYTFPASAQGWDAVGMPWTNTDGSPLAGCLASAAGINTASTGIESLSLPVAENDPFSFRVRIINNAFGGDSGSVSYQLVVTAGGASTTFSDSFPIADPDILTDSGWMFKSDTFPGAGTITQLAFTASGSSDGVQFQVLLDSVYLAETEPALAAKFYQGQDSLALKFDLPFATVKAASLALRQDGKVALANAQAGSPRVITVGPDNYGAYDNESHDHPDEAVQRVIWVK